MSDTNEFYYKIAKQVHLEDFKRGHLFFNHYSYFNKLENGGYRSDSYDSVTEINNKDGFAYLRKIGTDQWSDPIKFNKLQISAPPYTHIFCFSYYEVQDNIISMIDLSSKIDFYPDSNHYIVFDPYHLDIIIQSLKKLDLKPICEKIIYENIVNIKENQTKIYDGFTKDIKFINEQEIRIGITLTPNNCKHPQIISKYEKSIVVDINQIMSNIIFDLDSKIEIIKSNQKNKPHPYGYE